MDYINGDTRTVVATFYKVVDAVRAVDWATAISASYKVPLAVQRSVGAFIADV